MESEFLISSLIRALLACIHLVAILNSRRQDTLWWKHNFLAPRCSQCKHNQTVQVFSHTLQTVKKCFSKVQGTNTGSRLPNVSSSFHYFTHYRTCSRWDPPHGNLYLFSLVLMPHTFLITSPQIPADLFVTVFSDSWISQLFLPGKGTSPWEHLGNSCTWWCAFFKASLFPFGIPTEKLSESVETTNFNYTINGCRIKAGNNPLPHWSLLVASLFFNR